jgi:hypothetical protein
MFSIFANNSSLMILPSCMCSLLKAWTALRHQVMWAGYKLPMISQQKSRFFLCKRNNMEQYCYHSNKKIPSFSSRVSFKKRLILRYFSNWHTQKKSLLVLLSFPQFESNVIDCHVCHFVWIFYFSSFTLFLFNLIPWWEQLKLLMTLLCQAPSI